MANVFRGVGILSLVTVVLTGCSTLRRLTATEHPIDTPKIAESVGITELYVPTASCEVGIPFDLDLPDYGQREAALASRLSEWKAQGGTHWLSINQTVSQISGKLYRCSKYAGIKKDIVYNTCAESLKSDQTEACSDYLGYLKVEDDPELFAVLGERLCRDKNYWFCDNVPEAKQRAAQIAQFRVDSIACLEKNIIQTCLNLAHGLGSNGAFTLADQYAGKACSLGSTPGCSMQSAYIEKAKIEQDRAIADEQIRNSNMLARAQMANDMAIASANASAASYENSRLIQAVMSASSRPRATRCISGRSLSGHVVTNCDSN